ncbi:hypothetical protein BY996DRAFT_3402956 [Phakopsora pachyrhizi]|nr:hypothetical protein BY996DRAFT_3402956 [Phakopsora pachyrhizi]
MIRTCCFFLSTAPIRSSSSLSSSSILPSPLLSSSQHFNNSPSVSSHLRPVTSSPSPSSPSLTSKEESKEQLINQIERASLARYDNQRASLPQLVSEGVIPMGWIGPRLEAEADQTIEPELEDLLDRFDRAKGRRLLSQCATFNPPSSSNPLPTRTLTRSRSSSSLMDSYAESMRDQEDLNQILFRTGIGRYDTQDAPFVSASARIQSHLDQILIRSEATPTRHRSSSPIDQETISRSSNNNSYRALNRLSLIKANVLRSGRPASNSISDIYSNQDYSDLVPIKPRSSLSGKRNFFYKFAGGSSNYRTSRGSSASPQSKSSTRIDENRNCSNLVTVQDRVKDLEKVRWEWALEEQIRIGRVKIWLRPERDESFFCKSRARVDRLIDSKLCKEDNLTKGDDDDCSDGFLSYGKDRVGIKLESDSVIVRVTSKCKVIVPISGINTKQAPTVDLMNDGNDKLKRIEISVKCDRLDRLEDSMNDLNDRFSARILNLISSRGIGIRLNCVGCDQTIVSLNESERSIRWFALPSEDWQDFIEYWICHDEGDHDQTDGSKNITKITARDESEKRAKGVNVGIVAMRQAGGSQERRVMEMVLMRRDGRLMERRSSRRYQRE